MFETDFENKSFGGDVQYIQKALEEKKKFAFSKYADGELHILAGKPINNGEFWYVPEQHKKNRQAMIDSFTYKAEGYNVGISCPCCIGGAKVHNWMKKQCGQPTDRLTWANIFVNGNYEYYLENLVPLYKEYEVYLVSNSRSNLEKLPFDIFKHYQIGKNCWVENFDMVETIKSDITKNNIKDSLFLFCAGPFGNILSHQLFEHSQDNTYIDIGSNILVALLL